MDIFGNRDLKSSFHEACLDAYLNEYSTQIVAENDRANYVNNTLGGFNDFINMQFQVIYIPIINSKYVGEQSNIESEMKTMQTIYSQEDTNPSDKGFSSAVETYLNRLGNDDIQKLENETDVSKLPYLGEYLDFNGYRYYCNDISLKCHYGFIQTNLNYTKNYNRLNAIIGNPKNYVQYDIPMKETVRRFINTKEYIYIQENINNDYYDYIGKADNTITGKLLGTLNSSSNGKYLGPIMGLYQSTYSDGNKSDTTLVPIKTFYGKNSVKFQLDFADNYYICNRIGEKFTGDKYFEDYVPYADNLGEAEYGEVSLITNNTTTNETDNVPSNITYSFPLAPSSNFSFTNSKTSIMHRKYKLYKDKNEALSFVFNLDVITDIKSLDISENFIRLAFNTIDNIIQDTSVEPLKLYYFNYNSYGSLVNSNAAINISSQTNNSVDYIKLSCDSNITNNATYDGWIIKKGNLEILRKEQNIDKDNPLHIEYYISTRTEKLKTK